MLSHIVYNTTYMMSFFRVTASNCCNTELYQLPILDFNSWKTFQIKEKKKIQYFCKEVTLLISNSKLKNTSEGDFLMEAHIFLKNFPTKNL